MIEAELLQFAEHNTFINDFAISLLQKLKKMPILYSKTGFTGGRRGVTYIWNRVVLILNT